MKQFLDNNIKKITIILLGLLVIMFIVFIAVRNKKIEIKSFSNNLYSVKYDSSWKIDKKDKNIITLKRSNDAIINIQISTLDEKYKFDTIDSLIDEIVYGIGEQNKEYVMLGQEKTVLTKNAIDGYKVLYEYKDSQVLIAIFKQADNLIIYSYEAKYDNFDILLDSAQSVLYNFSLLKDKVEYKNKLDEIKTTNLSIKDGENYKTREYEISNLHYTIKYTMPSSFKLNEFDSAKNSFKGDKELSARISISNLNIYEEITKDTFGIEAEINKLKKDDENKELKVEIEKMDRDDSYIYSITYTRHSSVLDKKKNMHKVYMLISLDNSHTFIVELESENNEITRSLLDSIKIVKEEKYSENIILNYDGDNVINEMKKMVNFDKDKYMQVTLITPKKYREIDPGHALLNIYDTRYFGYDYNEKDDEYETRIEYKFTYLKDFNSVKEAYKSYDSANVVKSGTKKYNGYSFDIYDISYQSGKKIMYEKLLISKIYTSDNNLYDINFSLGIKSNKKINENMIDELMKFKTEIKDYK